MPVLGSVGDAPAVLESTQSDELVVTIPDVDAARLDAVARACEAAGVAHRVVRERTQAAPATTQAVAE